LNYYKTTAKKHLYTLSVSSVW